MNFPRCQCPLVIALLSIVIAARISASSTEPAFDRQAPPFWQFVLREFVFKTISSPRHRDDDLYKKLLEAPFYGGGFAVAGNDENAAVVSRGNVYNTPDGRWILCQDGCTGCEPCKRRSDDPVVTWTLRRLRRWTSPGSAKWDLRLTVRPQMDGSFRTGERRGRYDRAYATRRDDRAASPDGQDSVPSAARQNFAFARAPNFESSNGPKRYLYGDHSNAGTHDEYRRGAGRVKRYRSRRRLATESYEPGEDAADLESTVELPDDDANPRLIVGIDQNGKKHLVHLVPVEPLWSELVETTNHAASYRPIYKRENAARISRKIQERDASLYVRLIDRIVDSFNTHRNFVEKFLYSNRLESENRSEAPITSYSDYPGGEDENFDGRNLESYLIDDSRQGNQYPSGAGYQMAGEEEGAELRRYPDLAQEVNKPYGEYQDQNTMIDYEPYGIPAEDQEQQQEQQQQQPHQQQPQHQDERFLTLADVERKRRNSFAKLMDSTVGYQAPIQNHTQSDASDTEFSMKRDFLENSSNQALANSQPKINVTDARMR